jgi:DNA repair exonuclease SbcCD ATPase subunit
MKNEIKVILTADIKNLQAALSKAQQSLQEFEAKNAAETEKSNEAKKRQLGIIEKLNIRAKELQVSLTRATSKEEIIKFNQQLEQTKKKLSDLNVLGKSSTNPVGIINNLNVELRKLKSSIASATDEKQIAKLNVKLKQTEQELKRITALGQAKSGPTGLINSLNAEAKQLKSSISLATDEKDVARLNQELERTQQELKRINALGKSIAAPAVRSFDNLKKASGAATASAISFGRIIQDAPFGIIGVANNIQNFGEQFAALGGKATSAGGKLKLFFSALIQPTSLAVLAVSALTAAYQAYALGLFDAEEETKDLRTETEKFAEVLNNLEKNLSAVDSARLKANKSAANELAEVELLNSVLNDTSKSENERVIVYNKLLEKYPKIIGNITQEKALTEGLGEAYNLLIASIQERTKLEAISGAFAKVEEERILLLVKERKEFLTQNELFKQRNDLLNKQAEALAKVKAKETKNADRTQALRDYSDASAALEKLTETNNNFSGVALKTNNAIQENSATLAILKEQYGGLDQALADLSTGDKPEDSINRTSESLSKLNNSLEILSKVRENFFGQSLAAFFSRDLSSADIAGPIQGASMIYTENLDAMRIKLMEFSEALEEVGLTSAQVFQAIALGSANGFNSLNEFIIKLAQTQEFFNEATKILEQGIENTLGDVAFAIGNALGEGGNALKAGGAALLGGIAATLNQLGQLAIATGVTLEAIKTALETLRPEVAIAAGIALVGLAGFVSSQANKLSGNFGGGGSPSAGQGSTFTNRREFGGPVSKGRAYIVGEKRPELFVPNTNGIIIPQLPSMDYSGASMAAGAMAVDVNIRGVSYGDDILFTVQQAQIRRGIR